MLAPFPNQRHDVDVPSSFAAYDDHTGIFLVGSNVKMPVKTPDVLCQAKLRERLVLPAPNPIYFDALFALFVVIPPRRPQAAAIPLPAADLVVLG